MTKQRVSDEALAKQLALAMYGGESGYDRLALDLRDCRAALDQWRAAAYLCAEDEAFFYRGSPFTESESREERQEVRLALRCSDTFGYAVADCEDISLSDAPKAKELFDAEGWLGVVKWISEVRGSQPIPPILQRMERVKELKSALADSEAKVGALVEALEPLSLDKNWSQGYEGYHFSGHAYPDHRLREVLNSPPIAEYRERQAALERDAELYRNPPEHFIPVADIQDMAARVEELEAENERLQRNIKEVADWLKDDPTGQPKMKMVAAINTLERALTAPAPIGDCGDCGDGTSNTLRERSTIKEANHD